MALADSGVPLLLRQLATLDVAAASGMALRADTLYVVADDELELAAYHLDGTRAASIPLLAGALPEAHNERKAQKPDFEALFALPDGSLVALGSGSTARRMRGAWVSFDAATPRVRPIDLSDLYGVLLRDLPELNIEGATVLAGRLVLCSRGNGALRQNALIQLDLAAVLDSLRDSDSLRAGSVRSVQPVQLDELEGTPLSFTDLANSADQLLFSAAAEASANTYDDGACAGSVVGSLSLQGQVLRVVPLAPRHKIEGICARTHLRPTQLLLVADADDRAARAPLLAADWLET